MNKFFLGLLIFAPAAVVAHYAGLSPVAVFFLCALAIVPLAKFIGEATEELANRTTTAVGGFLNATFGNATELIIGIFALRAGLTEVVKASITGSIIGNLLLVLGSAMFLGGFKRKKQKFNATAVQTSASTLLLASIALVVPAVFLWTAPGADGIIVERLSVLVAVLMIIAYGAYLFFTLHTHKHLYSEDVAEYEPKWSVAKSVVILLAATLAVSWVSEILVGSIEPVVDRFGWTQLFIGVVFVAIIGNIAEHFSAITVAMKNRMDLAVQISIGSATQIIMFVAPALVIISLFFASPMSLIFNIFELFTIFFAILITNSVISDGESNWFEGVQLILAYVIIAIAFFFHP
jgi:Ca2+:H+ antiporter